MNYDTLNKIKEAARDQRVIKIIYLGKDGISEGWRYIEPYSIKNFKSGEGLFAWDISKNGIRLFMLNQIQDIEITNDEYIPRYPVEISWI